MTNHVETTREKPNFSGMTQTNVVSYENLESSTRKSARITSQPEKRPSLSEEDESDEDNYEDSEFRSSSDSQDEDKNGGELDVTRNKLGTITPEKKVQKVKSNTLNMTGYDRRKYQTERRILSLLSKHSKADVRQEIGKCTTPNGEFQSWEAIIQQPSRVLSRKKHLKTPLSSCLIQTRKSIGNMVLGAVGGRILKTKLCTVRRDNVPTGRFTQII